MKTILIERGTKLSLIEDLAGTRIIEYTGTPPIFIEGVPEDIKIRCAYCKSDFKSHILSCPNCGASEKTN